MMLPKFVKNMLTKSSKTSSVLVVGSGAPRWSGRNYKAFAKEGYTENVVVRECINKISDAVASVKWDVWRDGNLVDGTRLHDLLERPNNMQSWGEFISAKVGYLLIGGNAYDERIMINGVPREIYTHRPDRMSIVTSSTGIPARYEYSVNGQNVRWDVDQITGDSDILHTRLYSPLDDWYGASPIEAAAFAIDQHNEAMRWMQALLQNSARPSGALISKSDQPMTDEQFDRMKEQVEAQYSGSENAGRPMLLEGGLDWKQMGMSPSDVGIEAVKVSAARDIALAFGVPPQMIGIPDSQTYANYAEARLSFWEDTVMPLVRLIGGGMSKWLGPHFGDVTLVPNLDSVPAIADKRSKLWEMAERSTDLTINERRKLKGYEPIEGGDTILVNASMIGLADRLEPEDVEADVKVMAGLAGYGS